MDSINQEGKKELVESLISQFKSSKNELSQKIQNLEYWINPDSQKFFRIYRRKSLQGTFYFRIYFNDVNEIITDEFISNISMVTNEILKLYRLLRGN